MSQGFHSRVKDEKVGFSMLFGMDKVIQWVAEGLAESYLLHEKIK